MNNDFGRGVPDDVHHRVLVAQVDGHHCDRPQELYSPIIASGPNDGYHFVTLEAGLPSHGCADEARRARDKDFIRPSITCAKQRLELRRSGIAHKTVTTHIFVGWKIWILVVNRASHFELWFDEGLI